MIRLVLVATLFFMAGDLLAQDHSLMIRSDNNQPFFARIGEKTFNSNASGSLTIPGIQENTVSLAISFPGGATEENFFITLKAPGMSFLLKKTGEGKWMLQRDADVKKQTASPMVAGIKKQDAFSILMAGVVNDTAVLYNTAPQEEPAKDTIAAIKKTGTEKTAAPPVALAVAGGKPPAVVKPANNKKGGTGKKTVVAAKSAPTKKTTDSVLLVRNATDSQAWIPGIFKVYEKKLGTALKLIYVDVSDKGKIDSVDMQILYEANEPPPVINTADKQTADEPKTVTVAVPVVVPVATTKAVDKKPDTALAVSKPAAKKNDTVAVVAKANPAKAVANSNCKQLATEYDEDKIRVKMMNQPNDDDKVTEARKFFKLKCYSVKQLRNLSEVFPQDEGRYKFFDAAYPYVSDAENFSQLQALLIDPYYINRFKAMLKNN